MVASSKSHKLSLKNTKCYLKDVYNKVLVLLKKYKYVLIMILPFLFTDIAVRYVGKDINFFNLYEIVPNLFTCLWIYLFISVTLNLKSSIGKYVYLVLGVVSVFLYFINTIYFGMTNSFFDFTLLESAKEGTPYLLDTLKNANIWIYIFGIFIILLFYLGYRSIPSKKKNNYDLLPISLIIFIIIHSFIPMLLGKPNRELTWNTWRNPRNVYINFNDSNKSMMISGLYEYSFRNFYITYLKHEKTDNETEMSFLEEVFSSSSLKEENSYTGKMRGKNIIFLQLEGIDKFLVKKDIMPNLYNLVSNSINFDNHYSYYNGGGSTFNSEFAVNTGYLTPISYSQNAYTFNKNLFNYSLANIFKSEGYLINAFHMNSSEYYSRGINYANFGYDNYYGLKDMGGYNNDDYVLDTELINNEEFVKLMFPSDQKFVDYIITYSVHMPFSSSKGVCYKLLKRDYPLGEIPELTEEECIYIQAKETDDMIGLLIDKLKELDLFDDTVIVGYADHYLYTVSDKTILDKYKNTENNLINNTPFFIYNKDLKKKTIKKVTSQLNILPTVLNLFDYLVDPNLYIGKDALAKDYTGITFFSDYSWYDGNIYVEDGVVTNKKNVDFEYLEKMNSYIDYIIKKNDLVLKYNYFKTLSSKEDDVQDVVDIDKIIE